MYQPVLLHESLAREVVRMAPRFVKIEYGGKTDVTALKPCTPLFACAPAYGSRNLLTQFGPLPAIHLRGGELRV